MSRSARQQLTATLSARYRAAKHPAKQKILDEFVAATGYHRKYAIAILKHDAHKQPAARVRRKPRTYTAKVKDALVAVWRASNQLCSKRLVPFLPELVPALERHRHLSVSDETRTTLLGISPATTDRLLGEFRLPGRRRRYGGTRPGSLLKHQVPGYCQLALVQTGLQVEIGYHISWKAHRSSTISCMQLKFCTRVLYSTSRENTASQAVARKLHLKCYGTDFQVT